MSPFSLILLWISFVLAQVKVDDDEKIKKNKGPEIIVSSGAQEHKIFLWKRDVLLIFMTREKIFATPEPVGYNPAV